MNDLFNHWTDIVLLYNKASYRYYSYVEPLDARGAATSTKYHINLHLNCKKPAIKRYPKCVLIINRTGDKILAITKMTKYFPYFLPFLSYNSKCPSVYQFEILCLGKCDFLGWRKESIPHTIDVQLITYSVDQTVMLWEKYDFFKANLINSASIIKIEG